MIFRLRRSDIFCYAKCDIETYGFSDIIFALNCSKAITLGVNRISLRSNITRRKANITEKPLVRKNKRFWLPQLGSNQCLMRLPSEISLWFGFNDGKRFPTFSRAPLRTLASVDRGTSARLPSSATGGGRQQTTDFARSVGGKLGCKHWC